MISRGRMDPEMDIRTHMRPDLLALDVPDEPSLRELEERLGRPVVKLDANENPYGPSPRVAEALACVDAAHYPDARYERLRAGLGEHLGVAPERIVCSAGGDEMIDLILRLFLEPGDEVIDCTPSFIMYPLSVIYNHGVRVPVPRDERFAVDVTQVERAIGPRTKVIVLCSPNNPTGNPTPDADVLRILDTGRIVVLDEAYAEFAGRSLVHLVQDHPNLIVLRTMSKWAALAGLRLGYAAGDSSFVEAFWKIKTPYNVGAAAQAAGIASLEDRDHLMGNVARIVAERERLSRRLSQLRRGTVHPSQTSFVYWTTENAEQLRAGLARRGVMARSYHQGGEALRISVGTPHDTDVLLAALEETYAEIEG